MLHSSWEIVVLQSTTVWHSLGLGFFTLRRVNRALHRALSPERVAAVLRVLFEGRMLTRIEAKNTFFLSDYLAAKLPKTNISYAAVYLATTKCRTYTKTVDALRDHYTAVKRAALLRAFQRVMNKESKSLRLVLKDRIVLHMEEQYLRGKIILQNLLTNMRFRRCMLHPPFMAMFERLGLEPMMAVLDREYGIDVTQSLKDYEHMEQVIGYGRWRLYQRALDAL
jgi:hypothetical protein